jgi:hypothetical protein
MIKRWGGGRSALLLAALLPAACMRSIDLSHPPVGGGGTDGSDAGPVGGGSGVTDGGGGNADGGHLHCNGSASPMSFNVPQEKPAFMFALDRSKTMLTGLGNNNGTRFSVARDAINAAVSSSPYSSLVPFGYYEFPTGDSTCSNVCCAAGFPAKTGQSVNFSIALSQCSMSSQSLTCNTNSDSAPTGQALQKIANSWKQNSSNAPLYALLLTDGAPSNDCAFDSSPSAGNACEQTTNWINDMSSGSTFSSPVTPITTIVMAIGAVELDAPPPPSTPTYNSCLNKMAFAGGRPAVNSPTAYTLASTEASVHTQIDWIVTNAICTFDIDSSFDPKSMYEVDYNGSQIGSDPLNGFTLDKTKLTLTGSWCSTLITAMKNSTRHNITVKGCLDPSHPFQPQPNP